jgi:hypothetical protein
MRLFSLPSIARVKRGAEGAVERFEELKNNSKSVFLFEMQYSRSLSEPCRI